MQQFLVAGMAFTSTAAAFQHAHGPVTRAHGHGRLSPCRLRAEPIPLTVITRGIDRTLQENPSDLSTDDDVLGRLADIAARKTELASTANLDFSFGAVDFTASFLFGIVLWFGVLNDLLFAKASRPSDLVLPAMAKLLGYEGQWLDDFENGSRGQYPFSVLCFGIPTFFAAGCVVEQAVKVILGENNAGFAVQVGVVGCIWAGVYEIGRLETGDALNTPEIDKEIEVLAGEFDDFAAARLERVSESMSVNQIEVVQSFRRFHSRHRNVEYGGATDTMIEAQLRRWYYQGYAAEYRQGNFGAKTAVSTAPPPSAAGFYKGIALKKVGSMF